MINSSEKINEFYFKILKALEKYDINTYNEFNTIIKEKDKKEVYLWLNQKKEANNLPKEVIKIMPDLFGWIM